MRAPFLASTLAAVLLAPSIAGAQGSGPRIVVTPANPRMVAKDTLRLAASVVDESGKAIPGIKVRYFGGGAFEAHVDSTGLVTSGAVGKFPVVISALVPGSRPLTKKVEVLMVPGAAASVAVSPQPTKLLAGQRLQLSAVARSADGDSATERVTWKSSAPAIVRVSETGLLSALAPGRARIAASAGSAERALEVTVISANGASVTVTPASTSARQGDVLHFAVSVKDAAGKAIDGLTPSWTFSPGRGEIGSDGGFVGFDPGTYLVSANFGRLSGDASVTLTDRNVRRKATVVGSVLRTAFVTSEVWVHPNGKVAYLGTHAGGDRFYVINIADPSKPVIADSVMENFRVVNDIMISSMAER